MLSSALLLVSFISLGFALPTKDATEKTDATGCRVNDLSFEAFKKILQDATQGARKSLTDVELRCIFQKFDTDADGKLNSSEYKLAYRSIRSVVKPVSALLIIDVQNDFMTGTVKITGSEAIVPVINKLIEKGNFTMTAYSVDWHPENHISFIDNVHSWKLDPTSKIHDPDKAKVFDTVVFDTSYGVVTQKLWPKHCVQESWGAKVHADLNIKNDFVRVEKGYIYNIESYTAFGTPQYDKPTILRGKLEEHEVTELYLTGLALDVCVANTGKDALTKYGYTVSMVEDGQKGVTPAGVIEVKKTLTELGARYVTSDDVLRGVGITVDDRLATLRRRFQLSV